MFATAATRTAARDARAARRVERSNARRLDAYMANLRTGRPSTLASVKAAGAANGWTPVSHAEVLLTAATAKPGSLTARLAQSQVQAARG